MEAVLSRMRYAVRWLDVPLLEYSRSTREEGLNDDKKDHQVRHGSGS